MNWLVLVSTVPGQNGALRIRSWRALKALGIASLRDGVYALPDRPELADAFEAQQADITESGGSAYVFRLAANERDDAGLRAQFDRTAEFEAVALSIETELERLDESSEVEARRILRQVSREYAAIEAIDYFGSAGRERAKAALAALENALRRKYSPDEPTAANTEIPNLDAREFQKRTWATRSRLWVDRVACAWLIKRFIDHNATFAWLDDPAKAPPNAVGFDFDGAPFSHVNDLSTYEVMLESFGLTSDSGLARIGTIVHALDIGGRSVPEAAGFEAMLSGIRERSRNDDDLASKAGDILDSLYTAFGEPAQSKGSPE